MTIPLEALRPTFPVNLDLSVFPTLQSFSLDIAFSAIVAGIHIPKTFHIFNQISGRCSIRDIVITMGWTLSNPDDIANILSSDEDWRLFDEVITGSRFPFLKKLSLEFPLKYWREGRPSHLNPFDDISVMLSSGIQRCLPAVSALESVDFVVNIQGSILFQQQLQEIFSVHLDDVLGIRRMITRRGSACRVGRRRLSGPARATIRIDKPLLKAGRAFRKFKAKHYKCRFPDRKSVLSPPIELDCSMVPSKSRLGVGFIINHSLHLFFLCFCVLLYEFVFCTHVGQTYEDHLHVCMPASQKLCICTRPFCMLMLLAT
jgi:hypothetical protein